MVIGFLTGPLRFVGSSLAINPCKGETTMSDDGDELEGEGQTEEEIVESESDPESDAILHEQNESSPRDNI